MILMHLRPLWLHPSNTPRVFCDKITLKGAKTMKFVEYQDRSRYRIQAFEAGRVRINQEWIELPCAISPEHLIRSDELKMQTSLLESLTHMLKHYPAHLIIIGQAQPITVDRAWMQLMTHIQKQGVGLEQMTADAGARTFNVLTTEDRPIWLLLTV